MAWCLIARINAAASHFPMSGVIAGWVEALQLMNVGSTSMLCIPPQLAYGEHGAGGVIGQTRKRIFKVHLISIQ